MTTYSYSAVSEFVGKLADNGYEIIVLEGCLVDGYICLSHDDNRWNYVFREKCLNEWSSALTMRRFSKISGAMQKEIDLAYGA